MSRRWKGLAILLAVFAGTIHAAAPDTPRQPDDSTYVSPRLKQGGAGYSEPIFDGAGNGYFMLRLSISGNGVVTDVELMDGSFGNPLFINRAIAHLKTWAFEPATENGMPVPSRVAQPFTFHGTPATRAISAATLDGIKKVEEYYKAGDLDRARAYARELVERRVQTRQDLAALQAAVGIAEASAGDAHRALRALRDATVGYPPFPAPDIKIEPVMYLLPDANYLARLLTIQMSLSAGQGLLGEARRAYVQLAGLVELPADDPRRELAGKVESILTGNAPLTGRIRLDAKPWTHALTRRQFRFQNMQGPLQQVDLDCGRHWRTLDLKSTATMAVPDGWTDCNLRIRGGADATLVVVEFAEQAAGQ